METIYLERWLHEKIRNGHQTDPEYPHFTDEAMLSGQLTRRDIEHYQMYKLRKTLAYVYEHSAFYRERFKGLGIHPEDIQSTADFSEIPLTDPSDLAGNPNRFLCVSHGDISRVTTFTTSGTTGPEKRVFCTKNDLERMTDFMGTGLRTVADEQDILQIILPFGSSNNQGDLLTRGAEKVGITAVKAGMQIKAEEQINLIRQHHSTVLFGPTPYIYRMTKELEDRHRLDGLGVKTLFVTSGYLSEPMRNQLKRTWHCDVHTHYGLTEMGLGVAVECHAHDGYHFNEADLFLEVVDPQTGAVISEGEGELVFTTLSKEGMPLIRYRTHDLSRLITETCPCGADTLLRFDKISRRKEHGVRVGAGDEIYYSLFDERLYDVPELVDYHIIITRPEGKDHLIFSAEVRRSGSEVAQAIKKLIFSSPLIRKNIENGTMTAPAVELVALGTFNTGGRAKKKIEDHR